MNDYDDYEEDIDIDDLVSWVEDTETVRDEPYDEDLYERLNDYLGD